MKRIHVHAIPDQRDGERYKRKENISSLRGKTGIQGQRHALWLSLEMLIDTNNDDEYVDFMNHASW